MDDVKERKTGENTGSALLSDSYSTLEKDYINSRRFGWEIAVEATHALLPFL